MDFLSPIVVIVAAPLKKNYYLQSPSFGNQELLRIRDGATFRCTARDNAEN